MKSMILESDPPLRAPQPGYLDELLDCTIAGCHATFRLIQRCGPVLIALGLWQFKSIALAEASTRNDVQQILNQSSAGDLSVSANIE
jgi:hypothetical protein